MALTAAASKNTSQPPFHYGGQAVLEGVMMRGRRCWVVAARRPDGSITSHLEPLTESRWRRFPLLRGIVVLWETLSLGARALRFSANVALEEDDTQIGGGGMGLIMAGALLLAAALFFVLPLLLVGWAEGLLGALVDGAEPSSLLANVVEGVLRLLILLGYIWGIGLIPDIRRVFAYHGAEHKTINALEAGAPLTVGGVSPFSTAHTRCGTAFLLIVVVLAAVLFVFLGSPPWPLRLASRVVLIPVIAALAYELLRLSAQHHGNPVVSLLFAPSLALQALTTREPDDGQLEVALAALDAARAADDGAAALA